MSSSTPSGNKEEEGVEALMELAKGQEIRTVIVEFPVEQQFVVEVGEDNAAIISFSALEEHGALITEIPTECTGAELDDAECTDIKITGGKRPRNVEEDKVGYVRITVTPKKRRAQFELHKSGKAIIFRRNDIRNQLRVEHSTSPLSPVPQRTRGGGQNASLELETWEEWVDQYFPIQKDGMRKYPIPDKSMAWFKKAITAKCISRPQFATLQHMQPIPVEGNVLIFSPHQQKQACHGHLAHLMDYAKGQRQPKTDRTTEKVWKDILKMLLDFGFRAAKKREREMLEHEGIDKYDRIYVRDINLWNKNGHSLTVRPSFNKTQTKCTDSKNEVHVDPNKIRDTCINSINILLRAAGREEVSKP